MLNYAIFTCLSFGFGLKNKAVYIVLSFLLFSNAYVMGLDVVDKKEVYSSLDGIVNDTAKIEYLRSVIRSLDEKDSIFAKELLSKSTLLAKGTNKAYWEIKVLKTAGYFYHQLGNTVKSSSAFQEAFKKARAQSLYDLQMEILYAEISLNLAKGKLEEVVPKSKYLHPILRKLPSRELHADYLSEIGRDYYSIGDYTEAMAYYIQSHDIYEKHQIRSEGYGHLLHNIGSVFKRQGEYKKALDYYEQELVLGREIKSDKIIAEGLYLSASMYSTLGNKEKGDNYRTQSLRIYENLGDKKMVALLTGNLARNYADNGNYKKSNKYLNQALKIFTEEKEYNHMASLQSAIANNYSKLRVHDLALEYIRKAKENALKTNKKQLLRLTKITKDEAYIYYRKKDYKSAFDTYLDYVAYDDSLNNNEKLKNIGTLEAKYETEKKEAEIALLNKNKELKAIEHTAEVSEQRTMRNGMVSFILLIVVILAVIYRGYRINKKNNRLLSTQNDEINYKNLVIEEKNQNITDSIAYAKRIQSAILPPKSLLNDYLKNGFIFYEPKDVVAGDFYWIEKKSDIILFAAADCTGHGVPGAMISVVCHNALNRAVREFGLTEPAAVLNKVRELVIETFEKSEEEVKDGMDIALCSLNTKTNELQYAGANNPLYIIRDNEIIETKADKQPISQYIENKPFTSHSFKLKKGDTIYSFTDGFADQFGGEKGKKFKYKPFKDLLLSIQKETMNDQFNIIKETFHNWRGDLEQIDDVCVLGVKI